MGTPSFGPAVNGLSLIIDRGLELPDQFLTRMPSGRIFGEAAMMPTVACAKLIEALMKAGIKIKGLLPSTGDGLRKLLRLGSFTFEIQKWVEVPEIFTFMRSLGVSHEDCLTTFNHGIALYVIVSKSEAAQATAVAAEAGYELPDLGEVKEGTASVSFLPEGITLHPRKDA
jgi:phosphoribosylformylglycinamidine cyclo-ligase